MTAEIYQTISDDLISALDNRYAYVDLEISIEDVLYQVGIVSASRMLTYQKEDLLKAYSILTEIKKSGIAICGHNFRRFD